MRIPSRAKFLLKLAVSAGLVLYLVRVISWRQVGESLLHAKPAWLVAGYALGFCIAYLQALRWKILLRIPGLPVSKYLHFIFVGIFYRVILPGSLSADMLKVVLFGKKYNKPLHESSLIFFSQFLGLILQSLLGLAGLFFFGPQLLSVLHKAELSWRKLAVMGAAALVAAVVVPFVPAVRAFALRMLASIREALSTPGVLRDMIFATILIQCCMIGSAYCIFHGVGVKIPMLFLCFQMALANVLVALPISINGIGLVEYLNLFLIQNVLGTPAANIIAVSVTSYSFLVINALIGGAWILFRNVAGSREAAAETQTR